MSDNRRKVGMYYYDDEPLGLWSLNSMNTLRLEAMELFDRSLSERKALLMEVFIEQQLSQDPPPLDLLSQIAEDVHGRLMSLRQSHFEVRDDLLVYSDMMMAEHLYDYLSDWLMGMHVMTVRHAWSSAERDTRLVQ